MGAVSIDVALRKTVEGLELSRPRRAWTPGGWAAFLPTVLDPVLMVATPFPWDFDVRELLAQFRASDREVVASQLDESFESVMLWDSGFEIESSEVPRGRMLIRLGVPLIGSDRWFVRVRTTNEYPTRDGRLARVDNDRYAWFDRDGEWKREETSAAFAAGSSSLRAFDAGW